MASGLMYAKRSDLRADDQAFFYGIRAVAYSKLGNNSMAKSSAAVFMSYLEKKNFKAGESYDFAPLVSNIGDYYLANGQLDQAYIAFEIAHHAWSALEDNGRFNQAVSEIRLGKIERSRGNLALAARFLQNAASMFERIGARKDFAKTLFALADVHWGLRDYVKAISIHAEAVKIWTESKN